MLTGVEIITDRVNTSLRLPLQESLDLSGQLYYPVRNITGLDPVGADVSQSSFAQVDGVKHHGARRDGRNIVMTLGINPDYSLNTVASLREELYRYLMPKTPIRIRFEDDALPLRVVDGIVETFEAPIFTDDPEVQISILCPDPDFFSEDSFAKTKPSTPLGTTWSLNYEGTVPTGFIFSFKPPNVVDSFRLEVNSAGVPVQKFIVDTSIGMDHKITVNTNAGQHSIIRTLPSGSNEHALGLLSMTNSVWPQLYPGENRIRVYSLSPPFNYNLTWSNRYGGL